MDTTISFKIEEELREKAQDLIKASGLTAKDWFQKAIAMSELQSIKEGATDYASDLTELEIHTTRIFELVNNMVQKSIYLKDNAVSNLETLLEQQREITSNFQFKFKTAVDEKNQALAELRNLEDKINNNIKQVEEIKNVAETNQLLFNEYKEKNDVLTGLVAKYQASANENEQLKETINQLKQQTNDQQTLNKELEQRMNSLVEVHKTALERLEERKDLEHEKSLLQAERTHQTAITNANNEYSQKIQSLYEQLENERRTHEERVQKLQQELNIERSRTKRQKP